MNALEARFWSHVDKSDGCWIWRGRITKGHIYGTFNLDGRKFQAHRFAWLLTHGSGLRGKLMVCHKCDVPRCVNPSHLFLGSARDNTIDAINKGRYRFNCSRGEQNHLAKLTQDDVLDIIGVYGNLSSRRLAQWYGVGKTTIGLVRRGVTWTHVTDSQQGTA